MTRLKPIHAKLYRALLQRRFPGMTVVPGPEAQVTGRCGARDGTTLSWVIALDRMSSSWMLTFFSAGVKCQQITSTQLEIIDCELDEYIGAVFYAVQCREEAEAEAQWVEDEIARLANASTEAVLHGYLKAKRATQRADECVSEWDWHPAYTGPDDPGREYYEQAAADASKYEELFESELASRKIVLDAPTVYSLLEFFDEDAPEDPRRSELTGREDFSW